MTEQSLHTLVASLSKEVHQLSTNLPDVYISKDEVRRIRRRLRIGQAVNFLLGLLVVAIFLAVQMMDSGNDRDFRAEAVETDRAFCALTNRTFAEINKNREANRRAYGLLPADTPERRRFRDDLLATIDSNLPQLDCSGIGNDRIDFSLQDAIRNQSTIAPPPTSVP